MGVGLLTYTHCLGVFAEVAPPQAEGFGGGGCVSKVAKVLTRCWAPTGSWHGIVAQHTIFSKWLAAASSVWLMCGVGMLCRASWWRCGAVLRQPATATECAQSVQGWLLGLLRSVIYCLQLVAHAKQLQVAFIGHSRTVRKAYCRTLWQVRAQEGLQSKA